MEGFELNPDDMPEELKPLLEALGGILGGKGMMIPATPDMIEKLKQAGVPLKEMNGPPGSAKEKVEDKDVNWVVLGPMEKDEAEVYNQLKIKEDALAKYMKESVLDFEKRRGECNTYGKLMWGKIEMRTGKFNEDMKIDKESGMIMIKAPKEKEEEKK